MEDLNEIQKTLKSCQESIEYGYKIDKPFYSTEKYQTNWNSPEVIPKLPTLPTVNAGKALKLGFKGTGSLEISPANYQLRRRSSITTAELQLQNNTIIVVEEDDNNVYSSIISSNNRLYFIGVCGEDKELVGEKGIVIDAKELTLVQVLEATTWFQKTLSGIDGQTQGLSEMTLCASVNELEEIECKIDTCIKEIESIPSHESFTYRHANCLIICLEALSSFGAQSHESEGLKIVETNSRFLDATECRRMQNFRSNILLHGNDRGAKGSTSFNIITLPWLEDLLQITDVKKGFGNLLAFLKKYKKTLESPINGSNLKLPACLFNSKAPNFKQIAHDQTHCKAYAIKFYAMVAEFGFQKDAFYSRTKEGSLDEFVFEFTVNVIPFFRGIVLPGNLELCRTVRQYPSILYKYCLSYEVNETIRNCKRAVDFRELQERLECTFGKVANEIIGNIPSRESDSPPFKYSTSFDSLANDTSMYDFTLLTKVFESKNNQRMLSSEKDVRSYESPPLSASEKVDILLAVADLWDYYRRSATAIELKKDVKMELQHIFQNYGILSADVDMILEALVFQTRRFRLVFSKDNIHLETDSCKVLTYLLEEHEKMCSNASYLETDSFSSRDIYIAMFDGPTMEHHFSDSLNSKDIITSFYHSMQEHPANYRNWGNNIELAFCDFQFVDFLAFQSNPFNLETIQGQRQLRALANLKFLSTYIAKLIERYSKDIRNASVFFSVMTTDLVYKTLLDLLRDDKRAAFLPCIKNDKKVEGFDAQKYYGEIWERLVAMGDCTRIYNLLGDPIFSAGIRESIIDRLDSMPDSSDDIALAIQVLLDILKLSTRKYYGKADAAGLINILTSRSLCFRLLKEPLMGIEAIQESHPIVIKQQRLRALIPIISRKQINHLNVQRSNDDVGEAIKILEMLKNTLSESSGAMHFLILSDLVFCQNEKGYHESALKTGLELRSEILKYCLDVNETSTDIPTTEHAIQVLHSSRYIDCMEMLDLQERKYVDFVNVHSDIGKCYMRLGKISADNRKEKDALEHFYNALLYYKIAYETRTQIPDLNNLALIAYCIPQYAWANFALAKQLWNAGRKQRKEALKYYSISMGMSARKLESLTDLAQMRNPLILKQIQHIKSCSRYISRGYSKLASHTHDYSNEQRKEFANMAVEVNSFRVSILKGTDRKAAVNELQSYQELVHELSKEEVSWRHRK